MITKDKDALSPEIMEFAEKMCRRSAFPMVIVDDQLKCVFSSCSKLIPVNSLLSLMINVPVVLPLKKEEDHILMLGGESYCARFIPINKKYCFCEILGIYDILTLASHTNLYPSLEQRFALFEESYNNLNNIISNMIDGLPIKEKLKNMQSIDAFAELSKQRSYISGMSNFAYMAFSQSGKDELIDARELLKWLIDNSNNALADSEKSLEFLTNTEECYYILTNHRYAIIAILNAVHNALLYSPAKDIPIVSLTKAQINSERYITVQVVNSVDRCTKGINGNVDIVSQRCRLGIPIIKKFVDRAGGEFNFKQNNTTNVIQVSIPECIPDSAAFTFKSSSPDFYDIGVRDIINEMMKEIVSLFPKKKK